MSIFEWLLKTGFTVMLLASLNSERPKFHSVLLIPNADVLNAVSYEFQLSTNQNNLVQVIIIV